jgi:hypothetical protein
MKTKTLLALLLCLWAAAASAQTNLVTAEVIMLGEKNPIVIHNGDRIAMETVTNELGRVTGVSKGSIELKAGDILGAVVGPELANNGDPFLLVVRCASGAVFGGNTRNWYCTDKVPPKDFFSTPSTTGFVLAKAHPRVKLSSGYSSERLRLLELRPDIPCALLVGAPKKTISFKHVVLPAELKP